MWIPFASLSAMSSVYRTRSFYKLDAAIFLAKKVFSESDLLPPRTLRRKT